MERRGPVKRGHCDILPAMDQSGERKDGKNLPRSSIQEQQHAPNQHKADPESWPVKWRRAMKSMNDPDVIAHCIVVGE